ncbi:MAG TPA: FAD binding domain-containing protein [Polyangiales bacterium]|nr:FAD binding domain-containing protein [Polyangiales bacterium]
MAVRFILNGTPVRVDHVDPHMSLLAWLRASGRTGTKEGCAEGECGACAVALLRSDAFGRAQLAPINSCLLPMPAVDGQSIVSVEGIASGDALHPVQQAMIEQAGSQCGYCTPGFVISMYCEYYRRERDGYDPEAIAGNLCRCTGYRPIASALRSLPLPAALDPVQRSLATTPPALGVVQHESNGRVFLRPTGLSELFDDMAQFPNATLIAGGTDLMVYVNQRDQRYDALIALDALPELQRFVANEREIVIGAGLPLSHVEARLEQSAPEAHLLAQLWPLFSSRLIRNRATLGGNLGTASPIGDSPPALLALDAELTIVSVEGERRMPLREFFVGYRQTALARGELIASVHIPRPLPRIQHFYKASKRRLDDISTVAAAFALDLAPDRTIERLRIAYGGIAATPLRATRVEQAALGKSWNATTLARLLPELEQLGTPMSDFRGSRAYRRALIGKLFEKFFAETASLAEAAE